MPERSRTPNLLIRSQVLYPIELRALYFFVFLKPFRIKGFSRRSFYIIQLLLAHFLILDKTLYDKGEVGEWLKPVVC